MNHAASFFSFRLYDTLRRLAGSFILGFALWATSACQTISEEELPDNFARYLNARKPGNLSPWQETRWRGLPAEVRAKQRAALLMPQFIKIRTKTKLSKDSADATFSWNGGTIPAGQRNQFGSAFAIARDGYFLTAAHCVDQPMQLLVVDRHAHLRAVSPRVVWKGHLQKGGPDAALLHAPVQPLFVTTLAVWNRPTFRWNQPVMGAGWGGQLPSNGITWGSSAGELRSVSKLQTSADGSRWRELIHDAPVAFGDSGGPLFNQRGEVLGINYAHRFQWIIEVMGRSYGFGHTSGSVSIDPDWIQTLISKDRAKRSASRHQ